MKVSIIIPFIRPENVKRCITSIKENVGTPKKYYEIIAVEDTQRIGCPKMVKKLTDISKGEMVCFLGDDTIPQKDFLSIALEDMCSFPGSWGLVTFNDKPSGALSYTHWLAHKNLLPYLDGEFFHTGYKHCYCDNELMHRCNDLGRFKYSPNAKLKHEHPLLDNRVPTDEDYKRIYSEEILEHDKALFDKRQILLRGNV